MNQAARQIKDQERSGLFLDPPWVRAAGQRAEGRVLDSVKIVSGQQAKVG